jgi:hypothetical protein
MKSVLLIVVAIIIVIVIFYGYFGGFKKVVVQINEQGGETLVYEKITGDYRQSGVVMDKVYNTLLEKYNTETFKGFGIYYDNPQKVEKSKLRSEAGCIIEEKDIEKLSDLPASFSTKIFPRKKYITTEFPYKGKMSVLFSIMKVYPALGKFATENNLNDDGAVMEIYDIPNKKIYYRKEINQ